MRRSTLFFTALLFAATPLYTVTYVLHGSMSAEDAWYQKGGKFYTALEAEVVQRGDTLASFTWSGGIIDRSIIEGSESLVRTILEHDANEPITLVAHSNGGNVALYTTAILAALYNELAADISAQPPRSLYTPFSHSTKSATDALEVETALAINAAFQRLRPDFAKRMLRRDRSDSPYIIKEMYLMGTPINPDRFDADMSIVEHVFNLYSHKDTIQSLVGDQTLPTHERRTNLHVMLHNPAYKDEPVAPCHKHIRNPIIAKWLFRLKEVVGEELSDGYLVLHSSEQPTFQTTPPEGLEYEFEDEF